MIKIGIISGSTRPGRIGEALTDWVLANSKQRSDAQLEIVNVRTFNLPLLDEPGPASMGHYSLANTKSWAQKVAALDAFVFVTQEYNHAPPAALKKRTGFHRAE